MAFCVASAATICFLFVFGLGSVKASITTATYKYNYHNVLLNHFAYKEFHLSLPCKALESDSLRAGILVFNLFCERRPFSVRITSPSPATCSTSHRNNSLETNQTPRIYINIRTNLLEPGEHVDFLDPLKSGNKRLTSTTEPQLIEPDLQSYGQLLTTGPTALLQYFPSTDNTQRCSGKAAGGDSKFLELEYVLVTSSAPNGTDKSHFMNCPALQGVIPAGMLCDQYSSDRLLGCPLSISPFANDLSPADGQDRQNLDCYPLVFGTEAEGRTMKEIATGVLVRAPLYVAFPSPSSAAAVFHGKILIFVYITVINSFCIFSF